jgi:hypothetical protein
MTAGTDAPPLAPSDDSIDRLIPPPRPWWLRLTTAALLVGAIAFAGWLWNFGHIRPEPDCCGSGSAGPSLGLGSEPGTVAITAHFFNSSGRDVMVTGVDADLPGATVVSVAPYSKGLAYDMPPTELAPLPLRVEAHSSHWFAVTFRPDRCTDDRTDWGALVLDLEIADDPWWPTIGRTFRNPEPIVSAGPESLSILPPATMDDVLAGQTLGVLEAACRLLGR